MKKLVAVAILAILGIALNAQTINGIKVNELKTNYIEIVATSKFFSKKVTIKVDFGQRTKFFSSNKKTMQVKDKNGVAVDFNSVIDALNFFSNNGYKFATAYAITHGNQNVYHYLMEREK